MDDENISEEPKTAEKISDDTAFLQTKLLEQIIKETNIEKKIIEEKNSELWYETLTGKGKIYFTSGITYNGSVKNGILNSTKEDDVSTMIFKDGTRYEGEIKDNKLSGKGKFFFPTGATYTGEVLNGFRHGTGVYQSPEGISYEGEWKRGLKDGKGKLVRKNMTYEGEWKKGYIEGNGKMQWENGNLYEGEFANNNINGNGYMNWYDVNEKYSGQWHDNLQNGKGIHIWFQPKTETALMRNRYCGEWLNGLREGYGVFYYINGNHYEGFWEKNKKNGFGIFTFEDGSQYIGRFENDRMIDRDKEVKEEDLDKMIEKIKQDGYLDPLPTPKRSVPNQSKKNTPRKGYSPKRTGLSTNTNTKTPRELDLGNQLNTGTTDTKEKIKPKEEAKDSSPIDTQTESYPFKDLGAISNNIKEGNSLLKTPKTTRKESQGNSRRNTMTKEEKVVTGKNSINNTLSNNVLTETAEPEIDPLKKNLNRFNPRAFLEDIIRDYPEIESDLNQIENIVLRSLSEIRHLYNQLISKEVIENQEQVDPLFYVEKVVEEPKPVGFFPKKKKGAADKKKQKKGKSKPKVPRIIEEGIKTKDISFCLNLVDVWRLFRDFGLMSQDFTLVDFDRLYYIGTRNTYSLCEIPEIISEPKEVYSYIINLIAEKKNHFITKYSKYFDYYYCFKQRPQYTFVEGSSKRVEHSIHYRNNIILPAYFYEILIRTAFLKYKDENIPLSEKLQKLLNVLIPQKKKRRGSTMLMSRSRIEQSFIAQQNAQELHQRATEKKHMDTFFENYETLLTPVFKRLSRLYTPIHKNLNDKTIGHKFFYTKVLKRSPFFREIIPSKRDYVEKICSYYYKDKVSFSKEEVKSNPEKYYELCELELENELMLYEFFEIIYLISREYLKKKKLDGRKEEYDDFINKVVVECHIKNHKRVKDNYSYPKLKAHTIREKQLQEKAQKELEERLKKEETDRFTKERKALVAEDYNCFVEESEDEDEEEESEDY